MGRVTIAGHTTTNRSSTRSGPDLNCKLRLSEIRFMLISEPDWHCREVFHESSEANGISLLFIEVESRREREDVGSIVSQFGRIGGRCTHREPALPHPFPLLVSEDHDRDVLPGVLLYPARMTDKNRGALHIGHITIAAPLLLDNRVPLPVCRKRKPESKMFIDKLDSRLLR